MARENLALALGGPLLIGCVWLLGSAAFLLGFQVLVWLATADWIELDTKSVVMLWHVDDSPACATASGGIEQIACKFEGMQKVHAATPPLTETWDTWVGLAKLVDGFLALPAVLGLFLAGTAAGLIGLWTVEMVGD